MKTVGLCVSVTTSLLFLWAGSSRAAPLGHFQRADLFAHVSAAHVQADTDGNGLFDNLEVALSTTQPDQPLEVIVRYKPDRQAAVMAHVAGGTAHQLALDHSVATRLTAKEIRQLAASGDVESIE